MSGWDEGAPPAYGADFVSPQGLFTIGPDGSITGISLPLVFASSVINWKRQSDGAVIASIQAQQFGAAPNRQNRLLLTAAEPVDTGGTVDVSIAALVSSAGLGSFARNILEIGGAGLYGAAPMPKSDFLLQERMIFSLATGIPIGFTIDSNYRIYDLGSFSIAFQNSSISGDNPWSISGRLTLPHAGGYIVYMGAQGGVSGASMGLMATINAVTAPPGANAVSNFASAPGNSNISTVCFLRGTAGSSVQWSGWNSSAAPAAQIGVFAVPFDGTEL